MFETPLELHLPRWNLSVKQNAGFVETSTVGRFSTAQSQEFGHFQQLKSTVRKSSTVRRCSTPQRCSTVQCTQALLVASLNTCFLSEVSLGDSHECKFPINSSEGQSEIDFSSVLHVSWPDRTRCSIERTQNFIQWIFSLWAECLDRFEKQTNRNRDVKYILIGDQKKGIENVEHFFSLSPSLFLSLISRPRVTVRNRLRTELRVLPTRTNSTVKYRQNSSSPVILAIQR